MIYNPFYLRVVFPNETPEVTRTYVKGANEAVENMGKAINFYEARSIPCVISLYDHEQSLIVRHAVEQKKEAPL